jgi:hypothetical protein
MAGALGQDHVVFEDAALGVYQELPKEDLHASHRFAGEEMQNATRGCSGF